MSLNETVQSSTELLEAEPNNSPVPSGEVVIATCIGLDQGRPLLRFSQSSLPSQPVMAQSTQAVTPNQVGRQAAVVFVGGNIEQPLIIGFIYSQLDSLLDSYSSAPLELHKPAEEDGLEKSAQLPTDIVVDGKNVTIDAKEQIVLQCGESSITLTKSGKIMIRGKYVLSRSSGVNRILGGSVQVN
ncbi:DUF6484 domain-containing protein [Teredinibacter waterburyi]|jgi:Phage-related baseplate assembly protein.|uniref:DUF6484 domain-containing protein n=1 Tax=Teredinibacter waterburyi TaxID=1500538 RepID=UPI00165FA440|nr:DUF6484 domain-containing protein [Teredinibacter waterburyi]